MSDLLEHLIGSQEVDPVVPLSLVFNGPLDIMIEYVNDETDTEYFYDMYYHTHQTNNDKSVLIFISKRGIELHIHFDLITQNDRDSVYQYSCDDIKYIYFEKSQMA